MMFINRIVLLFEALGASSVNAKLASNAALLIADRLIRLCLGVAVIAWTARHLGPGEFGLLNLAQSIVVIFTALAQFGLPEIAVRDLSQNSERRREIATTAFIIRLLMGVIGAGLSVVTILVLRPDDGHALVVVIALSTSLIFQASEVLEYDLQASNRVAPIVSARLFSFAVWSGIKIYGIITGANTAFFAWTIALEAATIGCILTLICRKSLPIGNLRHVKPEVVLSMLNEALPLFLRSAAIVAYMRLDHLIIAQVLNENAVGIYASAVRIAEIWFFVPSAIMAAAIPTLARLYISDISRYERALKIFIRLLVSSSVIFSGAVTFWANDIVYFLYGEAYYPSAEVLRVYVWASIFGTLGLATSSWLINAGLYGHAVRQALVGLLLNAIIAYILIPSIGLIGGAIAYLVAQALSNYLVNAISKSTRPIFWLQTRALIFR